MDDTALSILSGITQGFEQASINLYNIGLQKKKLEREQEAFNIDKKIKDAELKKIEFEHGPEAVAHLRKKMDLESKQFKVANEIYDLALGAHTKENQEKLSSLQNVLQGLGIREIAGVKFSDSDLSSEEANLKVGRLGAQIDQIKASAASINDPLQKEKAQKQIDLLTAQIEDVKSRATKSVKVSDQQKFRDAVGQARVGTVAWEDVEMEYPDKIDEINKIRKQSTPVKKSEDFTEGTGGLISRIRSKLSPHVAELTPRTRRVIENIKTQADLDEFKESMEDYREAGVDVNAILEYFGQV